MVSARRRLLAAAALLPVAASLTGAATGKQIQLGPTSESLLGDDVVLRFHPTSVEDLALLSAAVDARDYDVWNRSPQNLQFDVRMPWDDIPALLETLPESLQHVHETLLDERDVQQLVAQSMPSQDLPGLHTLGYADELLKFNGPDHLSSEMDRFFGSYQPLQAIEPFLQLLASLYSSHASLLTIGTSAEGRPIHGLRIGLHPQHAAPAPHPRQTLLVVGGLHAREWISTSTVTYIAWSLLHSHARSPRLARLLKHFDFVLVPTLNPDGYAYTWTDDRLWRKTRQSTSHNFCPGIDLDRAFGFAWAELDNTCSESYPGAEPFAAVEAAALADWARNVTEDGSVRIAGFLDLHSYSETILYPYSYTCDEEPPSLENLEELASGLRRAISDVHGHRYGLMRACEENQYLASSSSAMETAAGGSALDYFYHALGVRYAYQLKLRDRGTYGFLLPPEHIVPTGKEIVNAVLFMGEWLWEAGEGGDEGDEPGPPGDGDDDGDEDGVENAAAEWYEDGVADEEAMWYDYAESEVVWDEYDDEEEALTDEERAFAQYMRTATVREVTDETWFDRQAEQIARWWDARFPEDVVAEDRETAMVQAVYVETERESIDQWIARKVGEWWNGAGEQNKADLR